MPRQKPNRIEGQFVAHRVDLIASEAWRTAGRAARGILDRLELEHMAHGGNENGNLTCTYDDFASYGIRRKSIAPALNELVELGLIEIVARGRGGNAAYRHASRYRLTYLATRSAAPTDEWRRYVAPMNRTGVPLRDIDSGGENATDPVGAKPPLGTA